MTGFRVRRRDEAAWPCLGVLSGFGCGALFQLAGAFPVADTSWFANCHTVTANALSTQFTGAWPQQAAHGRPTLLMSGS